MSAFPAPAEAANDGTAVVKSSRFVKVALFCTLTGYSDNAVRTKMSRGIWLEGRQFVRRGEEVLMDMEGYERWAETGVA